ncbi:MAG TPA: pyridoxamine 5'-phosphate oxidase family protein [Caldilineaceae bacterium]|nr:pyridoxamine 5'-phosphate oxidase family protein [Caldilineaceae bacterium]
MSDTNLFQEKFGKPSGRAATKVVPYMDEWVQNFIRNAPFAVLSTSNGKGHCDASPKGGKPGFVKILDETHLLIPDVAGNRLFQSYDNVSRNPRAGLLFMIPGVNSTARVNGTVEVVDAETLAAQNIAMEIFNPDEAAKILQGLLLTVEEAYGHCPRAFNFSDLWNEETIRQNKEVSPIE